MFPHQGLEVRPLDIYVLSGACDIPVISLQSLQHEFPFQFADRLLPQPLFESQEFGIALRHRVGFRQSGPGDGHREMMRFDRCSFTGDDGYLVRAFELALISLPVLLLDHFESGV